MVEISGHNSRGEAVFIVTTATFIAATIFVVARVISRFVVLRSTAADDWWMLVAWFLAFGLSFSVDFGTSKGLGRLGADIPDVWLPALRRSEYAFTILYNPALMATKTSILIFYLRMSRNTQNILRIASYVTLTVVLLAGIALTFTNAFQCSPVSAAYDTTVSNEKCISIVTLYLCSAPVNIITDLAILVLPIPVLTGMRLPQRQKVVLVGTFALGIFVTIVDVIRIYYLQQAADYQLGGFGRLGTNRDFSWNASAAYMWSAVEVNVGIICACIPTLKPLIKCLMPSMITDLTVGTAGTLHKPESFSSQIPRNNAALHRPESIAEPLTAPHTPPQSPPLSAELQYGMEHEIGMDFLTTTDGRGNTNRARARTTTPEQYMSMDFLTTPEGIGIPSSSHSSQTQQIDTMDFLNTAVSTSRVKRIHTSGTASTAKTTYFGFVNMKRPKSMLKAKGMESFKYCALVTTLFFLWGFSYGLLNTLNNEISKIAQQSSSQTLGLTSAYFGAYFLGALTVGQYVLRKAGFKATFITGLCIYGIGTLIFWPSAVLLSFPSFIISNFVVGFGLSVLETAANPFLALCGPPDKAEFRLLLAQGVQAVASVLSQLLAERVLFAGFQNEPSLTYVQWTYLAVALFVVILALFFYYMPLPEATDADLQQQTSDLGIYPDQTITKNIKLPIVLTTLCLAVFTQWCYVAAQESMNVWFEALLDSLSPSVQDLTISVSNYVIVGHTVFAIGRFLAAPLCLVIPPRIILLIIFISSIIISVLTMTLTTSANGIAVLALVFFFLEGPAFPLIYALGLRRQGKDTKRAAAWITAGTSGGAVFPFVMYAVMTVDSLTVERAYCVIVALLVASMLLPIWLNFWPGVRRTVDPVGEEGSEGGLLVDERGVVGGWSGESESNDWRRESWWGKRKRQRRNAHGGSACTDTGDGFSKHDEHVHRNSQGNASERASWPSLGGGVCKI